MLRSVTYHEASASLRGRHLVRSGDLAGDQSLEFLQLLEQGPGEGTGVTAGSGTAAMSASWPLLRSLGWLLTGPPCFGAHYSHDIKGHFLFGSSAAWLGYLRPASWWEAGSSYRSLGVPNSCS